MFSRRAMLGFCLLATACSEPSAPGGSAAPDGTSVIDAGPTSFLVRVLITEAPGGVAGSMGNAVMRAETRAAQEVVRRGFDFYRIDSETPQQGGRPHFLFKVDMLTPGVSDLVGARDARKVLAGQRG